MRRKRPMIPQLAVLTCAAVLLTACGSSSAATGGSSSGAASGGKLDVFVAAQPNYPTQFAAWSKDVTAKFKAATGADLTIETYATSSDETTKIQASIVSGNGPDVYQLGTTFTPVAYGTKGFATLSDDDWKKVGGRDKFIPESLGMSGPDAKTQIGIPTATRPFGVAYNTEMFKAAGIAQLPTTWDEMIADAQKVTKGDVYGLALAYADSFDPWKFVWAFTEQAGGSFVSADLKKAQLNSPVVAKAVTQYFDLLTKQKVVNPKSVGWKSADAIAAFATGKAAMLPLGTGTSLPTLDKSVVKGKYAFFPLPGVAPGMTSRPAGAPAAQTIVSGDNVAIASYTKNKDLALAYVNLITSKDMQIEQFKYFGNLPSTIEAGTEVAKDNPVLAPFSAAEKGATPTAFTGAWADFQNGVTNVVVQSLPSLAKGGFDASAVQSLLDSANAKAQSSLDRSNK